MLRVMSGTWVAMHSCHPQAHARQLPVHRLPVQERAAHRAVRQTLPLSALLLSQPPLASLNASHTHSFASVLLPHIGPLSAPPRQPRRILHSCIAQLLKEESDLRPEDIECLCKLMTTVGALLDRTSKPERKKAMEVREARRRSCCELDALLMNEQ
jgi:hypothetical protein